MRPALRPPHRRFVQIEMPIIRCTVSPCAFFSGATRPFLRGHLRIVCVWARRKKDSSVRSWCEESVLFWEIQTDLIICKRFVAFLGNAFPLRFMFDTMLTKVCGLPRTGSTPFCHRTLRIRCIWHHNLIVVPCSYLGNPREKVGNTLMVEGPAPRMTEGSYG